MTEKKQDLAERLAGPSPTGERTEAQLRFVEAMRDAIAAAELLIDSDKVDRATGLAVAVDIGTSAAFLFDLSDTAYDNATEFVHEAIRHASREER